MSTHQGIRRATPRDAVEIVELTRRCYGDTYRGAAALDPAQVAATIESGSVAYALALDGHGRIVGKAGLERVNARGCWLYGRVVVDTAARGRGVMRALALHLVEVEAPARGARWLIATPVTHHDHAQRSCRSLGFVPLGLLLGVYPADTTMAGFGQATQPVSIALHGLRLGAPGPRRRLALEPGDALRARAVLHALGVPSASGSRTSGRLDADLREDPALGLAHVQLSPGAGESPLDAGLHASLELPSRRIVWVDVPAEHRDAADLTRDLRRRGFGWAAYLPGAGSAGEDVVRLQRYLDPWPLAREELHLAPGMTGLADEVLTEASRELVLA